MRWLDLSLIGRIVDDHELTHHMLICDDQAIVCEGLRAIIEKDGGWHNPLDGQQLNDVKQRNLSEVKDVLGLD